MKQLTDISLIQKVPCLLNVAPEGVELWRVALFDAWLPSSFTEWKAMMDSLDFQESKPTVFLNFPSSNYTELTQTFGFPVLDLPDIPEIRMLYPHFTRYFEKYYLQKSNILQQSCISEEIALRINQDLPDIAMFLILDGFSFYESLEWEFPKNWKIKLEPCLVDGLSTTEFGMRRLIGNPTVTHRLFELGYKKRFGFSYWERNQNKLTDTLFSEFPTTQLYRVTSFEEILQVLAKADFTDKAYIQIVRTGLDRLCHNHRERPDSASTIRQLNQAIKEIIDLITRSNKRIKVFVTSDHGILWFNHQKIAPFSEGSQHPRYFKGNSNCSAKTLCINESGGNFAVLAESESIARTRKVTEWGFHGGISPEESLVPFLDITLA